MTATAPHSDSRCTATAETWGKTFRCTRPVGHPGDMHSMNMSEPELPSRGSEMTATIETSETMTAREIAKALAIGTRTRKFEMRDREGYTVMGQYGVPRYARVLNSLMRSDCSNVTFRIRTVAMALYKSISTGRMSGVYSNTIQERYTPYQLGALVARIAAECPETTIGGICDVWLADNIARLCGDRVEELNLRF